MSTLSNIERFAFHHHTLDQPFQAEGEFWLPESPEARVKGTLTYEDDEITLRLIAIDRTQGAEALMSYDLEGCELILGLTTIGPVTLWKTIRTEATNASHHFGAGEVVSTATHKLGCLYIGHAYESQAEIEFYDLAVGFDRLPIWVGHSPFGSPEEGSDALAMYKPFPRITAVVESDQLQLELFSGVHDFGGGEESMRWKHEVRFAIRTPTRKSVEWHLDRLNRLQAFMCCMIGEAVVPTTILGRCNKDWPPDETRVILPLKRPSKSRRLLSVQMLLPLEAVGDRLPDALARWMGDWERIGTAAGLLFGSLLVTLPVEFELLALTQGLETFHRSVHEGFYMKDDRYKAVATTLINAMPAEVTSDHREALKSRIEFGNEFSQRKRLTELLGSLDDKARELLQIDNKFIAQVVEERNLLTHRPAESATGRTGAERYMMAQRLKAFLSVLLLGHLGFTGTDIEPRFMQTRWGWASRGWRIPEGIT